MFSTFIYIYISIIMDIILPSYLNLSHHFSGLFLAFFLLPINSGKKCHPSTAAVARPPFLSAWNLCQQFLGGEVGTANTKNLGPNSCGNLKIAKGLVNHK